MKILGSTLYNVLMFIFNHKPKLVLKGIFEFYHSALVNSTNLFKVVFLSVNINIMF